MHSLSLASPSVSLLTPHPQGGNKKQTQSHFGIKFYSFRQHMLPRVPGNTTLATLVNALHQRPPHCRETHGMHYTRSFKVLHPVLNHLRTGEGIHRISTGNSALPPHTQLPFSLTRWLVRTIVWILTVTRLKFWSSACWCHSGGG